MVEYAADPRLAAVVEKLALEQLSPGSLVTDAEPRKPRDRHMPGWIRRLGLREPPPDPEAWTPIATGIRIDNPDTGASDGAARIAEILTQAGIEAQQRPYALPSKPRLDPILGVTGDPGPVAADRLRVSVLVRNHDLERATTLPELQHELSRQQQGYPVSDEELTRQSLQAGDEIRRETPEGD